MALGIELLTNLAEEHGIVPVQWQVKCHLIWSRL